MQQLSGVQPRSILALAAGCALLFTSLALAFPAGVSAKEGPTNRAQGQITQLPSGELLFRVLDLTIPARQPGVPHDLGAGFVYAVDGVHVLTEGNHQTLIAPGQGMWIGPNQQVEHEAVTGSSSHFWFIQIAPASDKATPPSWPYPFPNASIAAESSLFRPSGQGPYTLVLTDLLLFQGESGGPMGVNGPAGVMLVDGQVTVGQQKFPVGMLFQQPGDDAGFTNVGEGQAEVVAVRLLPAGAPLELAPLALPDAGEASGAPTWLWLLPAAGCALVVAGYAITRRGTFWPPRYL